MTFQLEKIPRQDGRIAIVTGANAGLGYETTLALAQKGAKVVMACRNLAKGERALDRIRKQAPQAEIDLLELDLGKLNSVRQFAETFRKNNTKLDLLINNAGIMVPPYSKTPDGFESQFGVNHLGHFLLTSLLIGMMPDSDESRIVSLSSNAHKAGKIHFDDLQSEKSYSRMGAYSQSKLACLMFADELQRRLDKKGKKILSLAAHPGASDTELGQHIPKFLYSAIRYTVLPLITHSPRDGALPTLRAALSTEARGGEYYGPQGFMELKGNPGLAKRAKVAEDATASRRLWEVSEKLTSTQFNL